MLLLDEPMAALDEARKAEILPYLERLRDETQVPILFVSHAIAEVARLATTIVVLEAGRWPLRLPELRQLQELLAPLQLDLIRVAADHPETLVAAAALGLDIDPGPPQPIAAPAPAVVAPDLLVHRGTPAVRGSCVG
jgi:energy-coupling factor transporter ATP-binding protein EcfA2